MNSIPYNLPNGQPNPLWLDSVNFVVEDGSGRIVEAGYASTGFIMQRADAGDRIVPSPQRYTYTDADRIYVDRSLGAPVVRERPSLGKTFDRTTLPVEEEAILPDLPACTVAIVGPWRGEHEHPGGDLHAGFSVPGIYVLTLEVFPHLPVSYTLTVESQS